MERLAPGARVILCGLIAQYNTDEMPPGPNPAFTIKARATVRGLVVYDHEDLRPEFEQQVSQWLRQGEISYLRTWSRAASRARAVLPADAGRKLRQGCS